MGGGRDKNGTPIYRRRNGIYERLDGKPIRHRTIQIESSIVNQRMSATARASMSPLPRNGREVKGFLQNALAIDDLNDGSTGNSLSKNKRKDSQLYQKLISGAIDTPNGGFLFQESRGKNSAYMKHNDMPSYKDVLAQIIPQLKPENLRDVIESDADSTIDGVTVRNKLWAYECFVTNNSGEQIRTYVKILPFHSNDGKPYAILVSLHRTSPMRDKTTDAQKGLV